MQHAAARYDSGTLEEGTTAAKSTIQSYYAYDKAVSAGLWFILTVATHDLPYPKSLASLSAFLPKRQLVTDGGGAQSAGDLGGPKVSGRNAKGICLFSPISVG